MRHGVGHLVDSAAREVELLAGRSFERLAHGRPPVGVGGGRHLDGRARWGVAGEVDELEREPQAALAVGQRVVEALQHRGLAAGEPLDDEELPEGPGAVEGCERTLHREFVQGCAARSPKLQVGDVARDVEVGVGFPAWGRERAGTLDDPLPQAGEHERCPLHGGRERIEIRRTVEDRQVGDVARQLRVPFEMPHERLELGELIPRWGRCAFHRGSVSAGRSHEMQARRVRVSPTRCAWSRAAPATRRRPFERLPTSSTCRSSA